MIDDTPKNGYRYRMRHFVTRISAAILIVSMGHPAAASGPDRPQPPMAPAHRTVNPLPAATVEIFSSPRCKYCDMAKTYFREKRIPFTEYNVDENRAAASRMVTMNPRGILPFVLINGRRVTGFMPEVYDRLLDDPGS
jgi:glutaredoxin